jgi:hypothetical protein
MSTKYISYVYKITTKEDKTRVFISSTNENLQNLLLFFIKNSNTNQKNKLYDWIRPLKKSLLKIKLIKSYPVIDKDEQKKREIYWIKKYETYGYEVIYNPYQLKKNKKIESKLFVCFENVSMEEIIKRYGEKILCISKNNFNFSSNNPKLSLQIPSAPPPPPPLIPLQKTNIVSKKQEIIKPLPVSEGDGYMNELKNLLLLRNSSNLSLSELSKKNKPEIKIKNNMKNNIKNQKTFKRPKSTINPENEVLKELKNTIKKIE